jgi:bacteriorhodopsin
MASDSPKRTYRWPWFVLAAVILAIILAVVWMSFEIKRQKRIRELNSSPSLPLR